jgi:cell division protein FtsW (lipid II flippase)
VETVVAIAGAVVIAFLVFTTLIKLVKTTLKTAFLLAAVLLLLMLFGIGPNQVWDVFAGWLGMGPDPAIAPAGGSVGRPPVQ